MHHQQVNWMHVVHQISKKRITVTYAIVSWSEVYDR